jgi:hypothetical protein
MKQKVIVQIFLGVLCLVVISCRHTRQIPRSTFPAADTTHPVVQKDSTLAAEDQVFNQKLIAGIKANQINFNTFSGKLKIDFENDKQKQQNISTNIRMQKDSMIWISVSAPIIGEVARAVITKDSLKAYDRLNKKVYLRDIASAKDLLKIPFDFKTLQDIIIGNPIFLTDSVYHVVKTPSVISFSCDSTLFTSLFNVFADDYVLQQSKVMDKDSTSDHKRSCELTYGDYKDMGGRRFATKRRVFVEEKNVTKIAMDFNRVEFDQPVTFPFVVPASGYTRE